MVLKKDDRNWRIIGDYRALNAQTKKDKYPIPSILDFTFFFWSEKHPKKRSKWRFLLDLLKY